MEDRICGSADQVTVVRMQCRHRGARNRLLVQEQNGVLYEVNACGICAEIAINSMTGFHEVHYSTRNGQDGNPHVDTAVAELNSDDVDEPEQGVTP